MSKQSYRYPRDEFDDIPEDAPTGVHRVPRSAWRKVVPFVVVAAVFAVVAYVGVTLWSGGLSEDSPASADDHPAAASPVAPKGTTKATPKTTPSDAASDASSSGSDTPPADADLSASVAVKNATSVNGLAAGKAKTLTDGGYTKVTTGAWTGAKPSVDTVYYKTDKATAQAVASALGIDAVVQTSNLTVPITVVLVSGS